MVTLKFQNEKKLPIANKEKDLNRSREESDKQQTWYYYY